MKNNGLYVSIIITIFLVTVLSAAGLGFVNIFKVEQDKSVTGVYGYVYEDFHAVGSVEVTESFSMYNLGPVSAVTEDIFKSDINGNPVSGSKSNSGSTTGSTGNSSDSNPGKFYKFRAWSVPGWLDLF